MANLEHLEKLKGQLERLPDEKFDMRLILEHRDCGTVGCIAGWASALNGGPVVEETFWDTDKIWEFAQGWLGLDDETADLLFDGEWAPLIGKNYRNELTREDAIRQLARMIEAERPKQLPLAPDWWDMQR